MLTHHQIKLEYNKILDILESYCITFAGINLVKKLHPYPKAAQVQPMLTETTQALNFLIRQGELPLAEISDIKVWLKTLDSNGSLSAKALLEVAHVLKISRELKEAFFENSSIDTSEFTILFAYLNSLYSNPGVEKKILSAILDENTISDDASERLNSIRRNKRKVEQEIRDKLNNFIHSPQYAKCIMEPIITIRNDRFVIPVKEEHKDNIKGFVHDLSSSGSTFFIEPLNVFELNNKLNNIKSEENNEIEKILMDLSKLLEPLTSDLKNNLMQIGKIDFVFAKAKYSRDINGIEPSLNPDKHIELINARHPLIPKETCVPITVELGKNFTSLVITGPNTGGKTVTLKTVGLLTLMTASGLHIPANEKSSVYVFDHVFASIGDEQSIQDSLSTFSSHMLTIIDILKQATSNSLVLLDELGSGTDPLEGACLAISLLEHFKDKNILTISTTHYQELKNYALITDGFENASSEFDVENLKPTYKLLIGIPGKSNAFSISKRLGLSDDILDKAKDLMSTDNISIEELMKTIHDDKLVIEKEKEEIEKNSKEIAELKQSLIDEKEKIKAQKSEIINKAKTKARELLLQTKEEANQIIKELNDMKSSTASGSLSQANKLRSGLNDSLKDVAPQLSQDSQNNKKLNPEDIQIGSIVHVIPLNQDGIILSEPNKSNEVQIEIGNIKMNMKIDQLAATNTNAATKANSSTQKTNQASTSSSRKNKLDTLAPNYSTITRNIDIKSMSATTEINVIGENIEDACYLIDKFLDNCALSKLEYVRIVHGKGTGKLREGIHKFLRKHPHVKSFRLGTFGEGEMGVTIVQIK